MANELPPLELTDEDYRNAEIAFGCRPTSLLTSRELQDLFLRRVMAESICRERQLSAALAELAKLRAELEEEKERSKKLEQRHGECLPQKVQMEIHDRMIAAEAERNRMEEALRGLLAYAEEVEEKMLVGDEGCHWPLELARAALGKEGE